MTENFYLAKQAILDNNGEVMGYELLYRDSGSQTNIDNPRHATASVLVNVLNQSGLKSIVGNHVAFINVDDSFLRHDFIESIPSATFVFELTATSPLDVKSIERIERLYKKNYRFSLDLDSHEKVGILRDMLPYLACVKIDASSFEPEHLKTFLREFKDEKITFIASKVEDDETFKSYKLAGCDAYQGYFFSKPKIIKDKKLDGNHLTLFKLSNAIQSGASISEIVAEFEKNPSITLQLLQFINSGAFHFRSRISSVHQVVTLLGRNTLVQWLMLLLYSKSFGNKTQYQNPLILMVKQRTEIMVNLMKIVEKNSSQTQQSEAYFVGILSLMDTLMHVPLKEVLSEFHVCDAVQNALFDQSGFLGELYSVTLAIENFDTSVIDDFMHKYAIDKAAFEKMMIEVFQSTTLLETSSDLA